MPAIRYYYQCVYALVDNTPSHRPVEVRRKDGTYVRLPWLGMICESAAEILPGLGYGKIRGYEITDGDGILKCEWRQLKKGEFVLGWRCVSNKGGQGIYGVVDSNLWPIVVSDEKVQRTPKLKLVS